MVQAVLAPNDSQNESQPKVNGEVSLRLHKIKINEDEKAPVGIPMTMYNDDFIYHSKLRVEKTN